MKRFLVVAVCGSIAVSGPTFAADMPVYKAPPQQTQLCNTDTNNPADRTLPICPPDFGTLLLGGLVVGGIAAVIIVTNHDKDPGQPGQKPVSP